MSTLECNELGFRSAYVFQKAIREVLKVISDVDIFLLPNESYVQTDVAH